MIFRKMKFVFTFKLVTLLALCAFSSSAQTKSKPTLYLVGDSTVNNSGEGFQGWGNVIGEFFDPAKINVVNRARGGRSSRTFYTENLWKQVADELKSGDFVTRGLEQCNFALWQISR